MQKKKARSKSEAAEIFTNTGKTNDLALFANTPAKAESLLQGLQQAAKVTVLYVNAVKTEFMCFKPDGYIPSLNRKPLKSVD